MKVLVALVSMCLLIPGQQALAAKKAPTYDDCQQQATRLGISNHGKDRRAMLEYIQRCTAGKGR